MANTETCIFSALFPPPASQASASLTCRKGLKGECHDSIWALVASSIFQSLAALARLQTPNVPLPRPHVGVLVLHDAPQEHHLNMLREEKMWSPHQKSANINEHYLACTYTILYVHLVDLIHVHSWTGSPVLSLLIVLLELCFQLGFNAGLFPDRGAADSASSEYFRFCVTTMTWWLPFLFFSLIIFDLNSIYLAVLLLASACVMFQHVSAMQSWLDANTRKVDCHGRKPSRLSTDAQNCWDRSSSDSAASFSSSISKSSEKWCESPCVITMEVVGVIAFCDGTWGTFCDLVAVEPWQPFFPTGYLLVVKQGNSPSGYIWFDDIPVSMSIWSICRGFPS